MVYLKKKENKSIAIFISQRGYSHSYAWRYRTLVEKDGATFGFIDNCWLSHFSWSQLNGLCKRCMMADFTAFSNQSNSVYYSKLKQNYEYSFRLCVLLKEIYFWFGNFNLPWLFHNGGISQLGILGDWTASHVEQLGSILPSYKISMAILIS